VNGFLRKFRFLLRFGVSSLYGVGRARERAVSRAVRTGLISLARFERCDGTLLEPTAQLDCERSARVL